VLEAVIIVVVDNVAAVTVVQILKNTMYLQYKQTQYLFNWSTSP